MEYRDAFELLRHTSYPGRGILLGRSEDGRTGLAAYFIMGRSAASRNRIFEWTPDGIRTKAFDESLVMDPSLLIYHPVRFRNGNLIVANGDQMESVCGMLDMGGSFAGAVRQQRYEPDAPNWTPRISGIMYRNGTYELALVRKSGPDSDRCFRYVSSYRNPEPGSGHFLSTYISDGDPLPSFEGEPKLTPITQRNAEELANDLWTAMDPDNRVAVFTAELRLGANILRSAVINKHLGDKLSVSLLSGNSSDVVSARG